MQKIFSSGPFSAVRPYLGGGEEAVGVGDEVKEPGESFERSETPPAEEKGAPPVEGFQRESSSRGMQVALSAFPQVVHLLVDPKLQWGENLAKEVGLPVVSLENRDVDQLALELRDPKFSEGFILEGYPADAEAAGQLDSLLKNVAHEDRRVLSWQLSDESHQEVLDHYMDQDLLWMVPDSSGPIGSAEVNRGVLSCLQGLPVLQ